MPLILLMLLLLSLAAQAETPSRSLFLTPQEQAQQESLQQRQTQLTLEALVYYGADEWQLWLNGQRFTPATRDPAIEIMQVAETHVTLRQRFGNKQRIITLAPLQSYDWRTGQIAVTPPAAP